MTPEGKIKADIKKLLAKYQGRIYYHMPVPSGYGEPTLDFIGAFYGRFFAIEAKAPTKEPSERQVGTIERMRVGGAQVFVIDGLEGIGQLASWLIGVQALNYD